MRRHGRRGRKSSARPINVEGRNRPVAIDDIEPLTRRINSYGKRGGSWIQSEGTRRLHPKLRIYLQHLDAGQVRNEYEAPHWIDCERDRAGIRQPRGGDLQVPSQQPRRGVFQYCVSSVLHRVQVSAVRICLQSP